MTVFLICLWFASAIVLGTALGQRAMPDETRKAVLTAYALLAGHVVQGVALMLVWGLLPLGSAYVVVVTASAAVGGVLLARAGRIRQVRSRPWGISTADTMGILFVAAIISFLSYRIFTIAYASNGAEMLFFHSAVVERMTVEKYPPTNPLEPDDYLRYRFGFHALAAAIRSHSPDEPTTVMALLAGALMPLLVFALAGASSRFLNGPRPGILASIFSFFGGSLLFWYGPTVLDTIVGRFEVSAYREIRGLTWYGNVMDMVEISPTVATGFVAFTIALWFGLEAIRPLKRLPVTGLAAIAALAYLGLMNEVYFVIAAAALVISEAFQQATSDYSSARPRAGNLIRSITILVVSYVLVAARGGLSGGVALVGDTANSVQMVPNINHFGSVPAPPNFPAEFWIPLLTPVGQLDTLFALVAVPVLLVISIRRGNLLSQAMLYSAAVGLTFWLTTFSERKPSDSYRLGEAAMAIFITSLPLVAKAAWVHPALRKALPRTLSVPLIGAALLLLMGPHLIVAASRTFAPLPQTRVIQGTPDVQAAQYLREHATLGRLLVPLISGEGQLWQLYADEGPGAAARDVLALSSCSIPMGHNPMFNMDAYLPAYLRASAQFDAGSLSALKIGWIYVLPSYLVPEQKRALQDAISSGRFELTRTFGNTGTETERWLFRVRG